MNSRNFDKDQKQGGWGRRDNRQPRFKKDFSGQDFYNQDWKNKVKKSIENPVQPKNDKQFNIHENYSNLTSIDFKWSDYCLLD